MSTGKTRGGSSVIDCQGVQGRARGKAREPRRGGTAPEAVWPSFTIFWAPGFPPRPSLDALAVHHTAPIKGLLKVPSSFERSSEGLLKALLRP